MCDCTLDRIATLVAVVIVFAVVTAIIHIFDRVIAAKEDRHE